MIRSMALFSVYVILCTGSLVFSSVLQLVPFLGFLPFLESGSSPSLLPVFLFLRISHLYNGFPYLLGGDQNLSSVSHECL